MLWKILFGLAFSLLAVWLLVSLYLLWVSPSIIFRPEMSQNVTIKGKYEEQKITNKAGEKLNFLWLENLQPKEGFQETVIIYFHGNWGRLPEILEKLAPLTSVLSPVYPGYNGSEGNPTVANTYETVDLAFTWLKNKGFKEEQIIVYGHSLGGASSVYAAANYNVKKTILVNTFSSMRSMCWRRYSIFCTFSGHLFPSTEWAKKITGTVRQFHIETDETVPYEEGQKLFAAIASEDKKFTTILGQHSNFGVAETVIETVAAEEK